MPSQAAAYPDDVHDRDVLRMYQRKRDERRKKCLLSSQLQLMCRPLPDQRRHWRWQREQRETYVKDVGVRGIVSLTRESVLG